MTWRELLGELGYETKPNRGNWRVLNDEEFSDVVMKFMADHQVTSYPDFQKKASDDLVPGEAMIKSRFGKNAVSMLLERSFDKYGAPKKFNRRIWVTFSEDELLDHARVEIEEQGLTTVTAYAHSYDRLKVPSYSALVHRFGGRKKCMLRIEKSLAKRCVRLDTPNKKRVRRLNDSNGTWKRLA